MKLKEISEIVVAEIEAGSSRQDIYARLVNSTPSEAGKIAYCIAATPDAERRSKYLTMNGCLFVLLLVFAGLNLVTGLPIKPGEPTIFLVMTTFIPLVFSYFVFKFHGGVYRVAGIWFLIDIFEAILFTGVPDGLSALKIVALFFIVLFSFNLARKVFPYLGILGPRKDSEGGYLI